jgi:hypothetical protein
MKKTTIRIIAVIVVLMLILSTTAFASMTESDYIAVTSAWITRDGNDVKVNFYIVGTNIMDKIGVKYIYLYEKNGNTWSLVETFDYTDPNYATTLMGSNTAGKSGHVTYSGSSSKSYFANCRFYAERNGGSDTYSQNTPTSHGSTP